MTPLVSVGIPTFNNSKMLKQAITSVLQQTYSNFEIIIVDDCSTDNTKAVVESFNDKRIRYHRTEINLRPPRSWNVCVQLAKGEFFALLPQDDVWLPDYLEKMINVLNENIEVGFAQCAFYHVDEQFRLIQKRQANLSDIKLDGEDALMWQMEKLLCNPVSVLFRKAVMNEIGPWREDYWDDWALIIRIAYRRGFKYIPAFLSCVREHDYNLCKVLRLEGHDSTLEVMKQQAAVFSEALPLSPKLVAYQGKSNKSLSYSCILNAFRTLSKGDFSMTSVHFKRAQNLYPYSFLSPYFIKHVINGLICRIHNRKRVEHRYDNPIINL